MAREPKRIEAGGSGQASGDLAFVREELDNAKRLGLPYFLHLSAGRSASIAMLDDVQRQALAMLKAEAAKVKAPAVAGERRKRAVITDETRAEVKRLVEAGKTGAEIAQALGISLPSVQNIKKALGLVKSTAA